MAGSRNPNLPIDQKLENSTSFRLSRSLKTCKHESGPVSAVGTGLGCSSIDGCSELDSDRCYRTLFTVPVVRVPSPEARGAPGGEPARNHINKCTWPHAPPAALSREGARTRRRRCLVHTCVAQQFPSDSRGGQYYHNESCTPRLPRHTLRHHSARSAARVIFQIYLFFASETPTLSALETPLLSILLHFPLRSPETGPPRPGP